MAGGDLGYERAMDGGDTDSSTLKVKQLISAPPPPSVQGNRYPTLDGWRAVSIQLVLAAHLFPLGPKDWMINEQAGVMGMAVFFCLSGFLIVRLLLRDPTVTAFLIRRFARILPLAWVVLSLAFLAYGASHAAWIANFLFYANWPPFPLEARTSHFWSLDVEMQFYTGIALAVLVFGSRALRLVPIAAVTVTLLRIWSGTPVSIVTWLRIDEILVGGTLALIVETGADGVWARALRRLPFWPIAALFVLSAHAQLQWLNYARPYFTATMVGITLVRPVTGVTMLLQTRVLAYIASVSYAVYIFHHFTMFGWLSSGTKIVKYAKRPLALALTFGLAHLSTFYFERPINDWAHRLTRQGGQSRTRVTR
jgi:peptidoglycan/LPS O-acetylase OafA/YrhL